MFATRGIYDTQSGADGTTCRRHLKKWLPAGGRTQFMSAGAGLSRQLAQPLYCQFTVTRRLAWVLAAGTSDPSRRVSHHDECHPALPSCGR